MKKELTITRKVKEINYIYSFRSENKTRYGIECGTAISEISTHSFESFIRFYKRDFNLIEDFHKRILKFIETYICGNYKEISLKIELRSYDSKQGVVVCRYQRKINEQYVDFSTKFEYKGEDLLSQDIQYGVYKDIEDNQGEE